MISKEIKKALKEAGFIQSGHSSNTGTWYSDGSDTIFIRDKDSLAKVFKALIEFGENKFIGKVKDLFQIKHEA